MPDPPSTTVTITIKARSQADAAAAVATMRDAVGSARIVFGPPERRWFGRWRAVGRLTFARLASLPQFRRR
jgi:hypothetical protein